MRVLDLELPIAFYQSIRFEMFKMLEKDARGILNLTYLKLALKSRFSC